ARFEDFLALGELAEAKLRSLEIGQDADGPADRLLDGADAADQRAHQLMVRMTHVDAEDIRTRLEQPFQHRLVRGCRPDGGEDLDLTAASHGPQFPGAAGAPSVAGWSVSWTIQLDCSPVSYSWKPARWKPRATQSVTPAILNSFSATHIEIGPSQRPPRSASSA